MPRLEQDTVVEEVSIRSAPYILSGRLAYPEAERPHGGVLLAGPHPLLGGDMENNVVRSLGDGLAGRGWTTLRFDYRGVGRSEGPRIDVAANVAEFWRTSHVSHELELSRDVQAALDSLTVLLGPESSIAVIGYSFGCALLPRIHAPPSTPLALVAPTLGKHDYDDYASVRSPMLVVAPEDDFACDPVALGSWFERLAQPKCLVRKRLDNHFFRGHEDWLVDTVDAFLKEQLP